MIRSACGRKSSAIITSYNCLAAATTALAYGIELTTIARGLESVDRLPGRMERVMGGQPFAVACRLRGLARCPAKLLAGRANVRPPVA